MVEMRRDQAHGLRAVRAQRPTKVVAIAGGKGGVGKSVVSINLGTALAELGRNVLLLDADFGLANADLLLGLRAQYNLEHVLAGDCRLDDVIVSAPSGLRVVPASSGSFSMANLDYASQAGLINAFSRLLAPVDTLLIDTAAGIGSSVLTFSEAAQRVIVVVCDEPASLTDAYGFIKVISRRQPGCRIEVLTNMTHTPAQGRELYDKLARVSHRFLGISPSYLGSIPHDEYLRRAVQRQVSVLEAYPGAPSSRAFKELALATDAWSAATQARGGLEFFIERLTGREPLAGTGTLQ